LGDQMCVGITPPCSKCGAPARWKSLSESSKRMEQRFHAVKRHIEENLNDDCPIREELLSVLSGRV